MDSIEIIRSVTNGLETELVLPLGLNKYEGTYFSFIIKTAKRPYGYYITEVVGKSKKDKVPVYIEELKQDRIPVKKVISSHLKTVDRIKESYLETINILQL